MADYGYREEKLDLRQRLQGLECRCLPIFHAELLVDVLEMLFSRGGADVEDDAKFGVGLSLGSPKQDLRFARGKP